MAIKRRKNKLQDLAASGIVTNRVSGSIPFEYSGPNSPLFTISEIPDPAPQGKSSFLIAGTELLKNGIEVKIEIIDSEGGVIYTEPVANYIEGNARRVSIEIYDDTPAGPAKLYILAQVDPEEWEDETGTDVTNYPSPQPLRKKGKRRKKKRKQRAAKRDMAGNPFGNFDIQSFSTKFFIPGAFTPPPGNDTRFRRRGKKGRRRGITSDISDQYNFIQVAEMQVVPTATNTEKILFYQEPRIKVFEVFKPFVSNLAETGSLVLSGSLQGTVINDTQAAGATSTLDSFGKSLGAFRRKRKFKKFAGKGGLSKRKRITRRASPEVDNYSFTSDSFNFGSNYVGATINVNNPSVDSIQYPTSRYTIPTTGSFEVIKVKNSSTIIPDKPFRIRDNQLQRIVDVPITDASFSIEFAPEATQSISVTNFRSYSDVRVANIRTFSGDVFRTKIYRKSEESIGDYEVFADLPLESSELLLNTTEGTGLERTGYFIGQDDVNKYWEVSQSLVAVTGAASASVMSYDIEKQMDSVYISGSNKGVGESVEVKLKSAYSFTLEEDVNYDFTAEIYGTTQPKDVQPETGGIVTKNIAELEVYISGSNIPAQLGNENFGAKLGVLRINDGDTEKDFKVTTGDFESTSKSTNCVLIFKANAGKWYVSDISIRPATETGFSPDLFTFQAPMPENEQRPEIYEFIAEFYDVNNNQADAFAFTTSGSLFQGSNLVITGQDNVLESNLFIGGESTSSGMHLGGVSSTIPEQGGVSGAAGSAFMRSVGFTGFTSASDATLGGKVGFMFWSGSVLPSSGDSYNGVGLEMIGESGSFRFGTNPSRFEVLADAFFVGRTGSQFISGSGGAIEISSSNFHLSASGDVIMQGKITATAGKIGGFEVTSDAITGSNFFISGASVDNEFFISASKFNVKASGDVTGSKVKFTGGKIASFNLSDDAFSTDSFFISSSATANDMFISASNFNVKASGDITGSKVKFTGGTIADFEISSSLLKQGDRFHFDGDPTSTFFISSSNFAVSPSGALSASSGDIAGWSISDTTLQGGNLVLSKEGFIKSADYQSDVKGFLITSQENGFAEFENARIRGTLSTTTFEKESVNAVGGQLFVANSTALTGSSVLAADTTMSVVNASGFSNGEILICKKVTSSGFSTEYIKILSASLDGDLSKDELHGRIYVQRGITSTSSSMSGSVGDPIGGAEDYEPGQVVVSTGKIGTGYIRLNANPNNQATPYIDIVERTGSSPYDVELKTRIGDLSGVAGSRNVPSGFTGFGIMSEVAFLSGSNIKLEAPSFLLGDLNSAFVSGSNGNIEISSSNFHVDSKNTRFFVGNIAGSRIEFDGSNIIMSSSAFSLGAKSTAFVSGSNGHIEISSSAFHLDTVNNTMVMSGSITAGAGDIGGWSIGSTTLSKNNVTLDSANRLIDVGSDADFRIRLKENTGEPFISIGNPTDTFGDKGIFMQAKDSAGDTRVIFSVVSDPILGAGRGLISLSSAGILNISSSHFNVNLDGSVIAKDATFTGTAKSDLFEFTSLTVNSGNEDDYYTNYTGSDYAGGTTNYTKLDLSGVTFPSRTYVQISRRAQYPIGHIVPPTTDGLSIVYLVFTAQTSGTYQQNLIWSFGAGSTLASVMNSATYRATEGGGRTGGLFFQDEYYDKFRGFAEPQTCLLGTDHGSTNGGGSLIYHMAHRVMEDVIYTMLCKDGNWFLLDISHSKAGPSIAQSNLLPAGGVSVFSKVKAASLQRGGTYGGTLSTGNYNSTGSINSVPFQKGLGQSLSEEKNLGNYMIKEEGSWDTAKDISGMQYGLPQEGTATTGRYGLLNLQLNDRSGIYGTNYGRYDIFNYTNVEDSDIIRLTLVQAHDSATTHLQLGDNVDYEAIKFRPQTGEIEAKKVLIGRTSPAATTHTPLLEIDGYISFDGFLSRAGTGGSDNGANLMNFYWDGSYIDGWVDTTEVWPNETSDYRIKENVTTMTGSFDNGILKKVNELRPINYTQKSCSIWTQSDDPKVSFLAHEMADVFPNIVKGEYNATGSDGQPLMQSYNNTHLTTYLVKSIQELTQAHNHLIAAITGSTDLNQLKASVTGSLIRT